MKKKQYQELIARLDQIERSQQNLNARLEQIKVMIRSETIIENAPVKRIPDEYRTLEP